MKKMVPTETPVPPQRDINRRFAAKLLLQFVVGSTPSSLRTCEIRTVNIRHVDLRAAVRRFSEIGHDSQGSYANNDGVQVNVQFVGIMDVMELGVESEDETVWYDIKAMVNPDMRKARLVMSADALEALCVKHD